MTTPNYDHLVTALHARVAALPALGDCPSDNAKALNYSERVTIQSIITGLTSISSDFEKPERLLAERIAERAAVLAKKKEIEQEIACVPIEFASVRERGNEEDRQGRLRLQLQLLHDGRLLRAPGVTYQRLSDLDARIADLQDKIARLRARHDGYVQTAEQLLKGVTVTT